MKIILVPIVFSVVFATGCASTIQHRGWVGGSLAEAYKPSIGIHIYTGVCGSKIPVLPVEVASSRKKAIFVSRVLANTPLSQVLGFGSEERVLSQELAAQEAGG